MKVDPFQGKKVSPWLLGIALLGTRLLLLAAVARFSGGREFTGDAGMHLELADTFLARLMGADVRFPWHPPLLGLLEALLFWPWRFFLPAFYVPRLAYISCEVLLIMLIWRTNSLMPEGRGLSGWVACFLVLNPMGWMVSTIMAQDEVIAAVFLAGSFLLLAREQRTAAVVLLGIGVVSAKIFLLFPLLAVMASTSARERLKVSVAGFAPLAVVYLWMALNSAGHDLEALALFHPNNYFAVGLWTLVLPFSGLEVEQAWWISKAGVVVVEALLLLWASRRLPQGDFESTALLVCTMFLWGWVFLFLVNPEYYLLLMPVWIWAERTRIDRFLLFMLMTLPWVDNFASGVARALERGKVEEGKHAFVSAFLHWSPVEPVALHRLLLLLCVLSTLGAAIFMSRALFQHKRGGVRMG